MIQSRGQSQYYSVLYSALIGFFVWLTIITVVFLYTTIASNSIKNDIEHLKESIQRDLENVLEECCTSPFNCTCQAEQPEFLCWDADANVPNLQSGIGEERIQYVVCNPGMTFLDGIDFWSMGDYVRFNPDTETWFKNDALGAFDMPINRYNITYELVDRLDMVEPDRAITTIEITIISIGNGYGIVNVPAINLVSSPARNCGPGTFNPTGTNITCNYIGAGFVTSDSIPSNMLPASTLTYPVLVETTNCYGLETFQCGTECGIGSEIIFGSPFEFPFVVFIENYIGYFKFGVGELDIIQQEAAIQPILFTGGCLVSKAFSFLYKMNTPP